MSEDRKLRLTPPSQEPTYKVGYRRTPTASRFKPGQSGNPKGRPRGARNKRPALDEERLKAIILEEAYRNIKVNDGKRQVTIPIAKAVMRSLAVNAARGQVRAQQLFAELLFSTESANKAEREESLKEAYIYKTACEQELDRRKALGIPAPELFPHPDDIVIDFRTGKVIVKGPLTKEEEPQWDWMRERLIDSDNYLESLTAMLKQAKTKAERASLQDDINHELRLRNKIAKAIGEPEKRWICGV